VFLSVFYLHKVWSVRVCLAGDTWRIGTNVGGGECSTAEAIMQIFLAWGRFLKTRPSQTSSKYPIGQMKAGDLWTS
jgi:hypothetical protein